MTTAYKSALESALRILGRRDHSVAELRRKLTQRQIDGKIIDQVISECRRLDYLDDTRFAKGLIRMIKRKGRGFVQLKKEFHHRGLDGVESERLLSEAYDRNEEFQIARQVASKKLGLIKDSQPRKRRDKIYRFLYSRGFSKAVILKTLEAVIPSSDQWGK